MKNIVDAILKLVAVIKIKLSSDNKNENNSPTTFINAPNNQGKIIVHLPPNQLINNLSTSNEIPAKNIREKT